MSLHKAGFVTIVGRPNVGKSTLMNYLLGQKVAIVSNKNQTTRNCIRGILTEQDYQLVFMDTPGIHKPKNRLGEFMMKAQREAVNGTDAIIAMLAADDYFGLTDQKMLENMKDAECPVFVVVNKIDIAQEKYVAEIENALRGYDYFAGIFHVSAATGEGTDKLLDALLQVIPEGESFFPEDIISDSPERFLVAEVVREQMLTLLSEEVPHGVGVIVEQMAERNGGTLYIRADILCERQSHKGIIIGKGGSMLKQIGSMARAELEELFECRVYLELFVKVRENWRNSGAALKQLGYFEE